MKVTGIRKRPKILPDGSFVDVYEISFISDKGISGTVDIPEAEFTPQGRKNGTGFRCRS